MEPERARPPLVQAVLETRAGRYIQAIELFEEHLEQDQDLPETNRRRLLSYYGLCLAMIHGQTEQPLAWCQAALQEQEAHPDLYFNLGMVYLRARQRELADEVFREGLRVDPDHAPLQASLERLTPRRRPLFPFLRRQHLLNKYCGLLRRRLFGY